MKFPYGPLVHTPGTLMVTTWVSSLEVDPKSLAEPPYIASTCVVPNGRLAVEDVALPKEFRVPLPRSVFVPQPEALLHMEKATVPPGVPELAATVAVKVTD